MSYAFNVRKVDGSLVLENHEYAGQHIPDGAKFTINGHHPFPGTSSMGTIGVSLAIETAPTEEHPYPTARVLVSGSAAYDSNAGK
jgi:hypothetical protein